MIRHETVNNDCKLLGVRGAQNLRTHEIDGFTTYEHTLAVSRAKRQEISLKPDVVECFQMTRRGSAHDAARASRAPFAGMVWLKPDATSDRVRLKPDTTTDTSDYAVINATAARHTPAPSHCSAVTRSRRITRARTTVATG